MVVALGFLALIAVAVYMAFQLAGAASEALCPPGQEARVEYREVTVVLVKGTSDAPPVLATRAEPRLRCVP
jgi:hypothetical protein